MKFRFDLKNRLDLAIVVSAATVVLTGAFLRFFKYFFEPVTLEKITYVLIPEILIFSGLIIYKIWRI